MIDSSPANSLRVLLACSVSRIPRHSQYCAFLLCPACGAQIIHNEELKKELQQVLAGYKQVRPFSRTRDSGGKHSRGVQKG